MNEEIMQEYKTALINSIKEMTDIDLLTWLYAAVVFNKPQKGSRNRTYVPDSPIIGQIKE